MFQNTPESCASRFNDNMTQALIEQLPDGHLIKLLAAEHLQIKQFLSQISTVVHDIKSRHEGNDLKISVDNLKILIGNLISAEPHHQREERLLFPELENRGISGPTGVMRQEHDILRSLKKSLLELLNSQQEPYPTEFWVNLELLAMEIVNMLGSHIMKEDNILYPMALNTIEDTATWNSLMELSEEIGPCDFIFVNQDRGDTKYQSN